jgi:hypothetical protein
MLTKNNIEKILDEILEDDEQVCWEGKPEIKSRLASLFVNLNLAALIGVKLVAIICGGTSKIIDGLFVVLVYVALLWYFLNIARGILEYTNTYYIVTNKGVYRCGGDFKPVTEDVQFKNMGFIEPFQTVVEGFLGTGSLVFSNELDETISPGAEGFTMKVLTGNVKGIYFYNIDEYEMVESITNTNLNMTDKTAVEKKPVIVDDKAEEKKEEEPKPVERPKTLDERRAEFLR